MDRYDALLENLKLTQRHGLEAVANRLNDFVAQLEGLVDTMKASVQDALPSDANELFPIAEVEAGLVELSVAAAEVPHPSAGVSLQSLRLLDGAKSQSELLRALLPLLGEHVGRALVLVIRDGVVTAWSGSGFENADAIRSWSGGIAASPQFTRLVESGMPLMLDPQADPLLSEWLADQGAPAEGALLPISLRGKLMGIVYVDHDGDQPWALDAAQAHIATACLLIDTLHNRTEAPSSMLAEIAPLPRIPAGFTSQEVFDTVTEPEPEPAPTEFGDPEVSAFEPATDAPAFSASDEQAGEVAAAPVVEEAVEVDYDFEPEPVSADPAGATFDPSATMRVEVAEEISAADFQPPPGRGPRPRRWRPLGRSNRPHPTSLKRLRRCVPSSRRFRHRLLAELPAAPRRTTPGMKRRAGLPVSWSRRSSSTTRRRSTAVGPRRTLPNASKTISSAAARCLKSGSPQRSAAATTIFRRSWCGFSPMETPTSSAGEATFTATVHPVSRGGLDGRRVC